MDAPKRSLQQTSPDIFAENTPKKHSAFNKMIRSDDNAATTSATAAITSASNNSSATTAAIPTANNNYNMNCFSWDVFDAKLNNALDSKLENVVRKEDIAPISAEIQQLRLENTRLQKEVQIMKSRLESVDKSSRRNNIVLSGLTSEFVPQALTDFKKLCTDTLKIAVNVVEARKIASGKSFVFTLNSPLEVNSILTKRRLLFGTSVFIDKDYTADERNKRYFLRQIGKNVKLADKHIKVRYGDHRIFVADKPFTSNGDHIVAGSKADAEFLSNLLSKVNYVCNIIVRDSHKPANAPIAAASNISTSN